MPNKQAPTDLNPRTAKLAARLRKKDRWSQKDGLAAARAWIRSGLSRTAFCKHYGLPPHRVKYWSDQLEPEAGRAGREVTPVLALHPVQINPPAEVPQAEPAPGVDDIELVTPTGLKILLGPRFNAETLRRVLEVIAC